MVPELERMVRVAVDTHPHEVKNFKEGRANITYLAGWVVSMLRDQNPNTRATLEDARKALTVALNNGARSCLT